MTNEFCSAISAQCRVRYGGTRPGASSLTAYRMSQAKVWGIGRRATSATC